MQSLPHRETRVNNTNPLPPDLRSTDVISEDHAVIVLNHDGEIDHMSDAARGVLDLRSGPYTGVSFFQRVPLEHAFRIRHILLELSGQDRGSFSGLLQLKTGLGPWQWFKVEATPRRRYEDEGGIVLRLFERGSRERNA